MNKKGIFKIKANGKERMMHYISENDVIYALSLNDTDLIDDIKNNLNITVILDIKSGEELPATININENKEDAKSLFNKMLEAKNTYFKEFDDRLITLEIMLK